MEPSRILRIFKLMDYLADFGEGRSLSEVSRHLDLPLSSAHDLLQTMVGAGVLTSSEKRYALGPLALSLGVRLAEAVDVRRVAHAHLTNLVERIEDDVYLAVSTGRNVMYVDHYPGTRRVSVTIRLGQRLYLHSTATGKLYAALHPELREAALAGPLPKLTEYTITDRKRLADEYDRIRENEVSISRQESFEGIVGVAVPVWDERRRMHAAIHVSILLSRALDDRLQVIVKELKESARAIGEDLGGSISARLDEAVKGAERGGGVRRARAS